MNQPNQIKTRIDLRKAIKELSARIDFGCNNCNHPFKERCCGSCADGEGYFTQDKHFTYPPSFYTRLFSEKTGYWRTGKGCILPRDARSTICLLYYCEPSQCNRSLIELYSEILKFTTGGVNKS